jgi:transcriptional regulator with XRE-family HTH domain
MIDGVNEQTSRVCASLGANLKAFRLAKGLTQEGLAELLELDPRHIQRIERGRSNPSLKVLVALSVALDVEPMRLLAPADLEPPKPGRPLRGKTGR